MNMTGLTYGRESKYLCERPLCSGSRHVLVTAGRQLSARSGQSLSSNIDHFAAPTCRDASAKRRTPLAISSSFSNA